MIILDHHPSKGSTSFSLVPPRSNFHWEWSLVWCHRRQNTSLFMNWPTSTAGNRFFPVRRVNTLKLLWSQNAKLLIWIGIRIRTDLESVVDFWLYIRVIHKWGRWELNGHKHGNFLNISTPKGSLNPLAITSTRKFKRNDEPIMRVIATVAALWVCHAMAKREASKAYIAKLIQAVGVHTTITNLIPKTSHASANSSWDQKDRPERSSTETFALTILHARLDSKSICTTSWSSDMGITRRAAAAAASSVD